MGTTPEVIGRDEGLRLLRAGQLNEAIAVMEKALESTPEDHELHMLLGVANHQKGDMAKSIHHMEQSVLYLETAKGYYNLGQAYEQVNRVDDATKKYRMAVALDSNYEPAKQALSKLLERTQPKPQVTTAVPTAPPVNQTQAMPPPAQNVNQTQAMPPPAADPIGQAPQFAPPAPPPQNGPNPYGYQMQKQREVEEAKAALIKSGLIYGSICGCFLFLLRNVLGAYLISALSTGGAGAVFLAIQGGIGAVFGALVGLWIGFTAGDEMQGLQAGAVLGFVYGTITGLLQGLDLGVAPVVMSALFGAFGGAVSGYIIGKLVDASIGQI